MSKDMLLLNII